MGYPSNCEMVLQAIMLPFPLSNQVAYASIEWPKRNGRAEGFKSSLLHDMIPGTQNSKTESRNLMVEPWLTIGWLVPELWDV